MDIRDQNEQTKAAFTECNWVYFATTAKECWTVTREFVSGARIIFAHVYNKDGIRMPNVRHLQPGHKILLVHGEDGTYHALFCCTVVAAAKPVQHGSHCFDVFSYADESLDQRLKDSGYDRDPVLKKFTGISIEAPQDLRHITRSIGKPLGNNTLRRWDEVFR
jgi:hypothetical protein